MQNKNEKISHHYISEFYLKGFINEDTNHLYVYDRNMNNIKYSFPNAEGCLDYHNSMYLYDSNRDNIIEDEFSKIEGEAGRIFKKIKKGNLNIIEYKTILIKFLTLLYSSNPTTRAIVSRSKELEYKILNSKKELHIQNYEIHNDSLITTYNSMKLIFEIFIKMHWFFIKSINNKYFFTSNMPIYKVYPENHTGKRMFVGLGCQDLQIYFPINKNTMLYGSWEDLGNHTRLCDNEHVNVINNILTEASEIIYAPFNEKDFFTKFKNTNL